MRFQSIIRMTLLLSGCMGAGQRTCTNDADIRAAAVAFQTMDTNCTTKSCEKSREAVACIGYIAAPNSIVHGEVLDFPEDVFENIRGSNKAWYSVKDCYIDPQLGIYRTKAGDLPAPLYFCDEITETDKGIKVSCGTYEPLSGGESNYLVRMVDGDKMTVTYLGDGKNF